MRAVSGIGRRCRTFALFFLVLASVGWARDKHVFVIHVAPPVNPETVQVGYFVTGDFGGVGDFRVDTRAQEIEIRLDQTSKPPKTLKAWLYASGCEFGLIRVDDLKMSDHEAQFACKALPTIDILAEFPRPAALKAYDLEVEVNYIPTWALRYFGITDGFVAPVRIATAAADLDGSFRFELPDFTKDPLFTSVEKNAWITFSVRERRAGNIVGELKAPESITDPLGMKVQATYLSPLMFTFVPAR
jgi:hypothetical protein